jgi:hypothetical protein
MLLPNYRANPVWLDPFCRNLELAAQAEHEDDLPENLSEIADLWNSPTRTHVSQGGSMQQAELRTWEGGSLPYDVNLPAPANAPLSSRELLGVSLQQSSPMMTDTCVQPSRNTTTSPSWARSFERGLLR